MTLENNMQKKCGFCGESIPVNASRCPYCGSILEITFDNNYGMNTDNEKQKEPDQMQHIYNPEESSYNSGDQNLPEQKGEPTFGENTAPEGNNEVHGNIPAQPYAFHSRLQNDASQNNNKNYSYNPLSNGMKVFLTVLFTIIPGVGQLAGIITAILFMNAEGDSDRKSFGVAILVASLIMFVLSCIGCFITIIAISSNQVYY